MPISSGIMRRENRPVKQGGLGHRDGAERQSERPEPRRTLARQWQAMGRIEHTLLDGRFSVRPNRPKTFARNHTIPQKVTNVSIHDKGPGHPSEARIPWPCW